MKHCKVLIEHIAESNKKRGTKTDKVKHVEMEEQRDPEVEMVRRWAKEVNKMILIEDGTKTNDCYLDRNRNF